jgi:uncharacterized protein DUF4424
MKRFALLALAALAAAPAQANDSTAEAAAGGLVLTQNSDIDMLSEDLFVSAEQVRVRYVFRNRSAADVRVTVAFPMPDRNFAELRYSDAAFPADFTTRVDGQPVRMQVERHVVARGVDHTALVRSLGLPISGDNMIVAVSEAVERMPAEQRQRLVELGLVETSEYDMGQGLRDYYDPVWTLRETWYWEQVFPAGRDLVVEHSYTPGVGGTAGVPLMNQDFRNSEDGRRYQAEYCTDAAFLAALERMRAREAQGGPYHTEQRIRYVLTTGGNWRSPIGDFRLVVDKGRPENIVSFCGQGVRRISPTQFEMRRTNWRPDRDLSVLIVTPNLAE